MSDIKIKTLEEIREMSIGEIEDYCKENNVSLVLQDGNIEFVTPS